MTLLVSRVAICGLLSKFSVSLFCVRSVVAVHHPCTVRSMFSQVAVGYIDLENRKDRKVKSYQFGVGAKGGSHIVAHTMALWDKI